MSEKRPRRPETPGPEVAAPCEAAPAVPQPLRIARPGSSLSQLQLDDLRSRCDPLAYTENLAGHRLEDVVAHQAAKIFAALSDVALEPLRERLSPCIVPVGTLSRRGIRLPVVWILHWLPSFEETCLGLRQKLGGDGLLVLLGRPHRHYPSLLSHRVVVMDLPDDPDEKFDLWRVLDVLDPSYRLNRVSEANAVFDDVVLEFATAPGQRHIVRINGHEFAGFQRSDLKFLRLLFIAAVRAADHNLDAGGWVEKHKLLGDDKDHDLEAIRDELRKHHHPDLTAEERAALVKTSKSRDGRIRLAVHPHHIRYDASLAWLRLIGEQQTRSKSGKRPTSAGAANLEENLARGRQIAKRLLAEARKLGVPGHE